MACLRLLLLVFLVIAPAFAQDQSHDLLRTHYEHIARIVADSLSGDGDETLSLVIEGSSRQRLAENAFVEIFQRRGRRVRLGEQYPVLRVLVLRETTEPPKPDSLANVSALELEARWETGPSAPVRYLGRFAERPLDRAAITGVVKREDPAPLIERMVEPLVVVAGSVLIVYLLFTVRN